MKLMKVRRGMGRREERDGKEGGEGWGGGHTNTTNGRQSMPIPYLAWYNVGDHLHNRLPANEQTQTNRFSTRAALSAIISHILCYY